VHARKAWLQGLSPKDNRDIPPLDHALVQRMKARFPALHLSVNGGIDSPEAARALLDAGMDGVMIGRAAYQRPCDILGPADRVIFGAPGPDRGPEDAVRAMLPYIERHLAAGGKLHQVTRRMLGLFAGRPGARAWRRMLSEGAGTPGAGPALVEAALAEVAGQPAA
jgi:tRNA-dihydrouridine synthase A